jgi:hypothetical protein
LGKANPILAKQNGLSRLRNPKSFVPPKHIATILLQVLLRPAGRPTSQVRSRPRPAGLPPSTLHEDFDSDSRDVLCIGVPAVTSMQYLNIMNIAARIASDD